jgi:hypothetical protein
VVANHLLNFQYETRGPPRVSIVHPMGNLAGATAHTPATSCVFQHVIAAASGIHRFAVVCTSLAHCSSGGSLTMVTHFGYPVCQHHLVSTTTMSLLTLSASHAVRQPQHPYSCPSAMSVVCGVSAGWSWWSRWWWVIQCWQTAATRLQASAL